MIFRINILIMLWIWLLSLDSAAENFFEPVPFKYPAMSADEFSTQLNKPEAEVAIISGAGPAGLLAAHAIEQTGKYSHVIIVEMRSFFSRSNTMSARPEVMARL